MSPIKIDAIAIFALSLSLPLNVCEYIIFQPLKKIFYIFGILFMVQFKKNMTMVYKSNKFLIIYISY